MKRVWSNAESKKELKKFYLSLVPTIRRIARKNGYAIGVHGTLTRDLDLIAAPWVPRCVKPLTLALRIEKAICKYISGRREMIRKSEQKPHGRIGFVIIIGFKAYIDLSVLPQR
jgi:hypothetical protein